MDDSEMRIDQRFRRSMRNVVREAFITGLAVIVPVIITAIVLGTGLQYVNGYLTIVAEWSALQGTEVMVPMLDQEVKFRALLIKILTPVVLLVVIFVVGLFVSTTDAGEVAVDYFDGFISRIPAVGGVYDSFRQMSDVVLESDTRNFRDVKLVEFPNEGTYTLGFVTTETPPQLAEPTPHDHMLTLFLPLAPNPVMGGHLVHLPSDRVLDVDMSVEEGVRAVVTSGVAVAGGVGGGSEASLSQGDLRDLAGAEIAEKRLDRRRDDVERPGTEEQVADEQAADRAAAYEDSMDLSGAETPEELVRRAREDGEADGRDRRGDGREHRADDGALGDTPAEAARRDPADSEPTETPPDETTRRNGGSERGSDASDRSDSGGSDAASDHDGDGRDGEDEESKEDEERT